MKSNLSKNAFSILIASGLLFSTAACSRTEKETTDSTTTTTTTTTADGDEAYSSYRTYVEEAERDTAYVYDSKRDWNKEISDREAAYNERLANVDKYATDYDAARKAELEDLKTRYNTNWETRRETYTSYGRAGTMRQQRLACQVLTSAGWRTSASHVASWGNAGYRAFVPSGSGVAFCRTVPSRKNGSALSCTSMSKLEWGATHTSKRVPLVLPDPV